MGSPNSKIQYSVPVTDAKPGETSVYRNPLSLDTLKVIPEDGFQNFQQLLVSLFKECSDQKFLGRRIHLTDGTLDNKYTWDSYKEVEALALALGSGIHNLNLTEEKAQFQDYKLKFISIYGVNSRNWMLIDIANMLYGYTTMPIYDTLGESATDYMFNQTELSTIFLTCSHILGIVERMNSGAIPNLKNIVVMDPENLTEEQKTALQNVKHYTFQQVIDAGKTEIQPLPTLSPEDICLFSYTSGTTGNPKGAMLSHKNLMSMTYGLKDSLPFKNGDVHVSYLPLAHVFERILITVSFINKGAIGFFNGDVKKLTTDLAILKPDFFASVPRLFNKFYAKIQGLMGSATGAKKMLVERAIKSKLYYSKADGSTTHALWDSLVFKKTKAILGGNVRFMITGSAPISDEVRNFLRIAFCCPFVEGYGQTEGTGAEFLTRPEDPDVGYVGGPTRQNEFKLIDVPEMNYHSTDKDKDGNPAPRGEVLVRGDSVIPGYYKDEKKTAAAFDKDGWLHSGDIGMILPNGALKIIDRRKNIFKLSIGEYVAPDILEQNFKTVKGVDDILVYGDSLKSYLVAIISSEEAGLRAIAQTLGVDESKMTYEELTQNSDLKSFILKGLMDKAKAIKLKSFEKIRKLALVPFSFESKGLCTATFKLKRHQAAKYFKELATELYESE